MLANFPFIGLSKIRRLIYDAFHDSILHW
jgi:hypothetical protein